MSFDKAKAMRNAERYVSQGKIRAAITEYRSVIDNDPRDIATLNMMGDLYAKNAEKRDAIKCYMQVAEHYNTQGFAQKAIAIYNKISRIQPDSIEVSAKLAELHKVKGSLSEARAHYTTLAEHYQKHGRRLEALAMYKQIALLDPNNTDVCMNLANSYIREGQRDDAVEAYAEAGARFSRQGKHEEAVRALMKGYDIHATDLRILNGLVKAQTALGRASKVISLLEEILENEPYNRDVLYMLIECCMNSQNVAIAEKAVIKLVEIEPANHAKFLDLIRIYLNLNDSESAARILTMSSEYLLAGGQADECSKWISEILERDPVHLAGLKLLVRYNSWLNDETGVRLALERLYGAASAKNLIEDERFALQHLVVIRPHETRFRDRLNEINEEYGFDESAVDENLIDPRSADQEVPDATTSNERIEANTADLNGSEPEAHLVESNEFEGNGHVVNAHVIDDPLVVETGDVATNGSSVETSVEESPLSLSDEQKIQKEIESVVFYIENDYNELAEKALATLAKEFGDRPEFRELRNRIGAELEEVKSEEALTEEALTVEAPAEELTANALGINEIRSEFGIEGAEEATDGGDYDTHYHTAVAYQEMGLMEEAIHEFQAAINLTQPDDGTRNFFHCSNLLGHCFLQIGMANHAITWISRALDTTKISVEEYHGLWYQLALAYEANGEDENAAKYFEKIYAENVDFCDVAERVKNMVLQH